jgi:ribonuclease-3
LESDNGNHDDLQSEEQSEQQANHSMEVLGERLGYAFEQPALLARALTHRSYSNESGGEEPHNERLEFLGDAVVGLSIGHYLMDSLPKVREGQLTKLRSMIVSEAGLSRAARRLDLGAHLRLGRGEEQGGGRDKDSILADAFEAVLGAIYLDGSFDSAAAVARRQLAELVELAVSGKLDRDFKTRLQEVLALRSMPTVRYRVVSSRGPDHEKVFEVAALLGDRELARAEGHSKKSAEQAAAGRALEILEEG